MSRVIRSVKNVVKNRTIPEVKCIEATSNDPWFPSTIALEELAQHTFHPKSQHEIYQILYRRLNDIPKNWRHVLKSLIVFEFLICHGHSDMYRLLTTTSAVMNSLTTFIFVDIEGKDKGNYIRERAKRMVKYIDEPMYYQREKEKSLKVKQRVHGEYSGGAVQSIPSESRNQLSAPEYAPKNREEEDLQLQLALAISKQEAQELQTKQSYHSDNSAYSDGDKFDAFATSQNQKPIKGNNPELIDIFAEDYGTQTNTYNNNSAGAINHYSTGAQPSSSFGNNDFQNVFTTQPTQQSAFYNDFNNQPFSAFAQQPSNHAPPANNNFFSPLPTVSTSSGGNFQSNMDPFDDFIKTASPFQSTNEISTQHQQPLQLLPPTNSTATQPENQLMSSDAFKFVQDTGLVDLSFDSMRSDRSYPQQTEKKKCTLNEMAHNNRLSSGNFDGVPSQFPQPTNPMQNHQLQHQVNNPYMAFSQNQPTPTINVNPFASSDSSSFTLNNSQQNSQQQFPPFTPNNNKPFSENPFDNNRH